MMNQLEYIKHDDRGPRRWGMKIEKDNEKIPLTSVTLVIFHGLGKDVDDKYTQEYKLNDCL